MSNILRNNRQPPIKRLIDPKAHQPRNTKYIGHLEDSIYSHSIINLAEIRDVGDIFDQCELYSCQASADDDHTRVAIEIFCSAN